MKDFLRINKPASKFKPMSFRRYVHFSMLSFLSKFIPDMDIIYVIWRK